MSDIDHLVPIKNAHNSGAWNWAPSKNVEYANSLDNPDHPIAVTAGANRSKGDRDMEDWKSTVPFAVGDSTGSSESEQTPLPKVTIGSAPRVGVARGRVARC